MVVIELQIRMYPLDRRVDFLQLRGDHVLADAAATEADSLVLDPPAKVNPHPQFGFLVAREPQRLVHPSDHFAKRFLVNLAGRTELLINPFAKFVRIPDLVIGLHQQVRQWLFWVRVLATDAANDEADRNHDRHGQNSGDASHVDGGIDIRDGRQHEPE